MQENHEIYCRALPQLPWAVSVHANSCTPLLFLVFEVMSSSGPGVLAGSQWQFVFAYDCLEHKLHFIMLDPWTSTEGRGTHPMAHVHGCSHMCTHRHIHTPCRGDQALLSTLRNLTVCHCRLILEGEADSPSACTVSLLF